MQTEGIGGDLDAINVIDNIESTLSKIDDNMERFVVNFRKREIVLEDEIANKDEQIRSLQDRVLRGTKSGGGFGDFSADTLQGDLKDHAFVKFVQKRLEESLAENKRYHAKYVDMREFAYTSVESLMKQLNVRKKNVIQNSNLNVYKQLFDKERNQWLDEREKVDQKVDSLQDVCHSQSNELRQCK